MAIGIIAAVVILVTAVALAIASRAFMISEESLPKSAGLFIIAGFLVAVEVLIVPLALAAVGATSVLNSGAGQ